MRSLDESRLLKLSRSEILIWMLKSLRKERKRGGYEVINMKLLKEFCVSPEGQSFSVRVF